VSSVLGGFFLQLSLIRIKFETPQVNNHTSATWKDHYLTHHRRFDDMVSRTVLLSFDLKPGKAKEPGDLEPVPCVENEDDVTNMGEPGEPFNDSDVQLFAKHMASQTLELSTYAICKLFAERVSFSSTIKIITISWTINDVYLVPWENCEIVANILRKEGSGCVTCISLHEVTLPTSSDLLDRN
jgi:hypothetical protein